MISHFGMPLPFLEMADHFQKLADLMTHMDDLKNTAPTKLTIHCTVIYLVDWATGIPRCKRVASENIHTLLKGHWKF